MKILVFSDIHGDLEALKRLLAIEADLYFAAGDLTSWARGLDSIGALLSQRAGKMYVLPGNHESVSDIAGLCEQHRLTAFHGQSFEAGGVQIAGLGYSNPTPFDTPGEYTESEMAGHLEAFAALDPLVLVCHAPPWGTRLDQMAGNRHAGSRAVAQFITANQPAAFFCGHIHESHGRSEQLGRTMAWNVGKKGVLLDFDKLEL